MQLQRRGGNLEVVKNESKNKQGEWEMTKCKKVTHDDVKKVSSKLPKVWSEQLSLYGIYYRVRRTSEFSEGLILAKRDYGDSNNYIKHIPIPLEKLYNARTKKRLSLANIDALVYPVANDLVAKLAQRMRGINEPQNESDLLKMEELDITSRIEPLVWVNHYDDGASVVFHIGNSFPGVPRKYLTSGHRLEEYVKDFINFDSSIKGPVHIGFDSEHGMFCMYTEKGYAYDLYRCAKAFSDAAKQKSK